jgi:hypothetical protein
MMMANRKLTLDTMVKYRIIVPGEIGDRWSDWLEGITITITQDRDNLPMTVLTGKFDQAALHGVLRRLYSFGVPLISINRLEVE